jgi:uncharacterized protein YjbJ (UPF0337 family)
VIRTVGDAPDLRGGITMADHRNLTDKGLENSAEGKTSDLKGKVKDAVGGLTGDTSLQAEGKMDQAKGKVQDTFGKAQRKLDNDDV